MRIEDGPGDVISAPKAPRVPRTPVPEIPVPETPPPPPPPAPPVPGPPVIQAPAGEVPGTPVPEIPTASALRQEVENLVGQPFRNNLDYAEQALIKGVTVDVLRRAGVPTAVIEVAATATVVAVEGEVGVPVPEIPTTASNQAKLDLVRNVSKGGYSQDYVDWVSAVTDPRLSAFVTFTDNGSQYSVDVANAVKVAKINNDPEMLDRLFNTGISREAIIAEAVSQGVGPQTLKELGVTDTELSNAQTYLKVIGEIQQRAAVAQLEKQTVEAQAAQAQAAQEQALRELAPWTKDGGKTYNLAEYLRVVVTGRPSGSEEELQTVKKAVEKLKTAGFAEKDVAQARVAAFGAGTTIGGKPIPSKPGFFERKGMELELWSDKWRSDVIESAKSQRPGIPQQLLLGAGGVLTGLVTLVPSMAVMAGEAVTHPTKIPSMAKGMAEGIVASVKTLNPSALANPYDIALATFNLGLIAGGAAELGYGAATRLVTWVSPRGAPFITIGRELSTGRIPVKGLDPGAVRVATTEALRKAMEPGGPVRFDVPIEGTDMVLRGLKTPLQREYGNLLFHGSNKGLGFVEQAPYELVVTRGSQTARVPLPPDEAVTAALRQLTKYSTEDVARLDVPQVRSLNLSDARDIPPELATKIQDYIRGNDGVVYGSFVEWLKVKNAASPNDVDVVFRNAAKARSDIAQMARGAGYTVRTSDRGVQIYTNGSWTTIVNAVDPVAHAKMNAGRGFSSVTSVTKEGFATETLGTQILGQAFGSLKTEPKALVRGAKVTKMAPVVVRIARIESVAEAVGVPEAAMRTLTVGERGMYNSPWAAIGYARGENPGLVMIVTDASKVIDSGVAKLTESGQFIRQAREGFYGPSKLWRGDLETEVVGAPGTELRVPEPTADLATRLLAGKYSDFFTRDNGRFVPIKIAVDKALIREGRLPALLGPIDLTAAKLATPEYALKSFAEALKHPEYVLTDIVRQMASPFKHPEEILESPVGAGGGGPPPGIRDVYLIADWGTRLRMLAADLKDAILSKVTEEAKARKVEPGTKEWSDLVNHYAEIEYAQRVGSALRSYTEVAAAYNSDPVARQKFEDIYLAYLGLSIQALARTGVVLATSVTDMLSTIETLSRSQEFSGALSGGGIISSLTAPVSETLTEAESRALTPSISGVVSEPISSVVSEPIASVVPERPVSRVELAASRVERPVSREERPVSREERPVSREERREERPVSREGLLLNRPKLTRMKAREVEIPPGSIAWRQGEVFGKEQIKYIPPPYDVKKPLSLIGQRPIGYRETGRTPAETIQIIGEATEVPKFLSVDLGVVDAFVYNGTKIEFKGKGLETDVGRRIVGPTTGLSIGEEVETVDNRENWPSVPYGSTFAESVRYQPKTATMSRFIEARIAEQVSVMTPEQIAAELKGAGYGPTDDMTLTVMRHLPDEARAMLTRLMEAVVLVPVGAANVAEMMPSWRALKRREPTQREVASMKAIQESELKLPRKSRPRRRAPVERAANAALTAIVGPEALRML